MACFAPLASLILLMIVMVLQNYRRMRLLALLLHRTLVRQGYILWTRLSILQLHRTAVIVLVFAGLRAT